MQKEKKSENNNFFLWYEWLFSIFTLGIYAILKIQKINYKFEILTEKIKNITSFYKNELVSNKNLYEQKIRHIENQKNEKDKRIFELKNDLDKRSEQISKLLKDKDEQLNRLIKEKEEQIKLKNEEISKLNNENGGLKNNNKNLDLEKEKLMGKLNESITKNDLHLKKISELEQQLAIEKNMTINTQLINSNPHNCSKQLTDYVTKVYEECFGGLQKYAKLEKEKSIQSNNKNKRADFLITFYKHMENSSTELEENFRVVIECKNYDVENNEEKLIENKYLLQLIEYSRLFNAKYAILLTTLKIDKDEMDYPFTCINDWSKLEIKGVFKNPNDADLFIVRPEYFELFLKIFRFLNDSTNLNSGKRRRIHKSINFKDIWEFIEFIKKEITYISHLEKHMEFIQNESKKMIKSVGAINKRIEKKVIPTIKQISSDLYEKTDDIEIMLPQKSEKLNLPTENINEIKEIEIKQQN